MTLPDPKRIYAVIGRTWPARTTEKVGDWTIREGGGGGSRVSSATLDGPLTTDGLDQAEAAMRALNQPPLVMVRARETALDAALEARGYKVRDAVNLYAAALPDMLGEIPPVTCFTCWPPLAVQRDIWAAGGIGEARLAVMDRAPMPKVSFLGRLNDRPAGTVFAGIDGDCAMIHALEVARDHRKKGMARWLTLAVARWANAAGARYLTLVTTQDNVAANGLYQSLGMTCVGGYHYRIREDTT